MNDERGDDDELSEPPDPLPGEELVPESVIQELAQIEFGEDERVPLSVRKIVFRIVLIVGTLAISAWVLLKVFDDLDWAEVWDALKSLNDAEAIALAAVWILWIAAQGLLTASLIRGLPVRRGVIAYLGPASVTSIVPGPSDLPIRFRMLRSWGRSPEEATLAVAAGGIFNIGIKLVLPVVAAAGLLLSGSSIDGNLRTIVIIAILVGIGLLIVGFALGSEKRTHALGRLIDPIWRAGLRLLRKRSADSLGDQLVEARTQALEVLRGRWLVSAWATVLTAATKFALLLIALRATGVPDSAIGWFGVFVAYAVVQGLTVIPITAGDSGVSEIAYISLLTATAGSQYVNAITAGVLLFRIITWLAIIPVGFGVLGAWQWGLRRAK